MLNKAISGNDVSKELLERMLNIIKNIKEINEKSSIKGD
jgi:hypothetical protein